MAASSGTTTIESLLLRDTPARIRERYLTLAERAEATQFGLLEEDLIMLDTETTGLSFRHDQLIEIACARISGRTIVDTFQTFVYPKGPIPEEIVALTGITNADVADAPSPAEAVRQLAEFCQGQPIVAHNATFDRTFIEAQPGGHEVSDTWVDSLSLSRIALPRLSSHRLQDMAQAFGLDPVTHRAMDDVYALAGLWRIMLLGLSDMPQGLMGILAEMHPDVYWAPRAVFAHLAQESFGAPFSLRDVRLSLVEGETGHKRRDAFEEDLPFCVIEDTVRKGFEADGVVSRMYEDFETREQQVEMARAVSQAFENDELVAIEAPTGVGKSMAYLLPACVLARGADVTVGVATKTNALTDQLMSHELPALADALPGGVTFTGLKGYDHYPCLHRLDVARVRELPVERMARDGVSEHTVASDMLTAIACTLAFACQSPDGDVDALGIRWRSVPRDLICASHSECLRSRCPYYPNACFVHGARRRAASSDVVVTNHSLLLRDIELEGAILPPIRHWVVDEAHSFEQEARRQWALELSAEKVGSALQTLGGISTGTLHTLIAKAAQLEGHALFTGLLTKAASKVQSASVALTDLVTQIHDLVALAPKSSGYDTVTLWIDSKVRESEQWGAVTQAALTAAPSLEAALKALGEATDALSAEAPQMALELNEATRKLQDVQVALRAIVLEPSDTYVFSAELTRSPKRRVRERLVAEKLDIGSDLANTWYPETKSVVYTSATIAVGESFDHFKHATGLDLAPDARVRTLRLSGCYDYENNMSVVVARDLVAPGSPQYLEQLEQLLYDVHCAMQGSVLTLFTNRREMEMVYAALKPRLAAVSLGLVCQERQSSPRRLGERFLKERSLSLFALKSFWEGFDAAGDTLRCVVIVKLPFASPNDPLVRERDAREQRAWFRYSLPEAVLSVKQAAGRLIRTSTDTGILVLADSRVASKRYGATFLKALPSEGHQMMESTSVGRYIRLWRASHEGA